MPVSAATPSTPPASVASSVTRVFTDGGRFESRPCGWTNGWSGTRDRQARPGPSRLLPHVYEVTVSLRPLVEPPRPLTIVTSITGVISISFLVGIAVVDRRHRGRAEATSARLQGRLHVGLRAIATIEHAGRAGAPSTRDRGPNI